MSNTSNISNHHQTQKEAALYYHSLGIATIPIGQTKRPTIAGWKKLKSDPFTAEEVEALYSGEIVRPTELVERKNRTTGEAFKAPAYRIYQKEYQAESYSIAVLTGKASGELEAIDVDTKYDITGQLWSDLQAKFKAEAPEVFSRLVIAQTRSGGYHLLYRIEAEEIPKSGNQKLASRYPIEGEDPKENPVLIETRGEGGYILVAPAQGYSWIEKDPKDVPTISLEEREKLLEICRSFNQIKKAETLELTSSSVIREKKQLKNSTGKANTDNWELTSLDDYNERGDALDLLYRHGWSEASREGERIYLKRPGGGRSEADYSGNFHTGHNSLIVFSTSTEFEAERPYSSVEIFTILECSGDFSEAAKKLGKLGYGKKKEDPKQPEPMEPKEQTPEPTIEAINIEIVDLGNSIQLQAPEATPREALLAKIAEVQAKSKKSLLIVYTDTGEEVAAYKYQLEAIFSKYREKINQQKGELSDRQELELIEEVVQAASSLDPIQRDLFKKLFLDTEAIQELGITEQSLDLAVDRLTSTKAKEEQKRNLESLIKEAGDQIQKGKIKEAIATIEQKINQAKVEAKQDLFIELLKSTTREDLVEEAKHAPTGLNSGYVIAGDPILLPPAAVTVYAGATGHGKTVCLINTALNVLERHPDKSFIFFSYEERATAITRYFINTFVDQTLGRGGNRTILQQYYKGEESYIDKAQLEYFKQEEERFFKEYIDTGRLIIRGVDLYQNDLELAISYLAKHKENLGGVFIDYFQLLNYEGEVKKELKVNSRQEELKAICQNLNKVAKETGLPIALAAQFNREVKSIANMHPTNIGEAGDIERIVNTLIGIYDLSKGYPEDLPQKQKEAHDKKANGYTRGMYVELMKSRQYQSGGSEVLRYKGDTGKVYPNDQQDFLPFGGDKGYSTL